MSLEQSDQTAAAVAKGPRVSLKDIEASIEIVAYITGDKIMLHTDFTDYAGKSPMLEATALLTLCLVVMKNGFIVVGKSAPAAPENYDPEVGRKFAYEDCLRQMWPLMGYKLRDDLHNRLQVQQRHG